MRETFAARPGEEIDAGSLGSYLHHHLSVASDALEIEQFPAGSSNLTYLVRVNGAEYVLRRPPFGNTVRSAHDMAREFSVLSKLSIIYAPAPKPLLFCADESVIGSEFYLMERRRGLVIRGRSPDELADSREMQNAVCRSFIENLAQLHSLDFRAAGLAEIGKPDGYCRRQVEGWSKRYFVAKTDDLPEIDAAIEWLNAHIPDTSGAAIVHNDYKFDNIMLDPQDLTRVTAVLDWEMVTIGDPLMDLGTTLGYWMSKDVGDDLLDMPFNPRVLMTNISRTELADMYASAANRELPDLLFYYVFGTVKIAVIAQQIYARFDRGFTADKRFANFNRFVAALGHIAHTALENGSI